MSSHSRRDLLAQRSELLQRTRAFFAQRNYLEIDAPLLVRGPTLDPNIDSFSLEDRSLFLSTSPEFQLKRLVAEGLPRLYSLGHVFRRGELGAHHNPEFMMLEWYRVGASWREIAEEVIALIADLSQGQRQDEWRWRSVQELFSQYAKIQLSGEESESELAAKIVAAGLRQAQSGRWEDLFFTVFLDVIEPTFMQQPTVVYDWPVQLASLARRRADNPAWVERFEIYAGGLELCNGFGELTSAAEQRQRFTADNRKRHARGQATQPIDEKFLACLDQLPEVSGVAVGFDRLCMLLLGVDRIADILPFGFEAL